MVSGERNCALLNCPCRAAPSVYNPSTFSATANFALLPRQSVSSAAVTLAVTEYVTTGATPNRAIVNGPIVTSPVVAGTDTTMLCEKPWLQSVTFATVTVHAAAFAFFTRKTDLPLFVSISEAFTAVNVGVVPVSAIACAVMVAMGIPIRE